MRCSMSNKPGSGDAPRRWRRWFAPTTGIGAVITSLIIWLEELIALLAEFIGVILIPLMAGLIFIFNHIVFKSAMPKKDEP